MLSYCTSISHGSLDMALQHWQWPISVFLAKWLAQSHGCRYKYCISLPPLNKYYFRFLVFLTQQSCCECPALLTLTPFPELFFTFFEYFWFVCHPSEASTRKYCAVLSQVATHPKTDRFCCGLGKEPDPNPGLLTLTNLSKWRLAVTAGVTNPAVGS